MKVCSAEEADHVVASLPSGWEALSPLFLRLEKKDTLLVLPYSQYTRACAARKGKPEKKKGLSSSVAVDEGDYCVRVIRPSHPTGADRECLVVLAPTAHAGENVVEIVPGCTD